LSHRQPPRYRQLADALRAEILSGRLQAGDLLPTEMDLCATHDVSRHTAREALRLLTEEHLIARRQGAGSVVLDVSVASFTQRTGDFGGILQYARDATFLLERAGDAGTKMRARFSLVGDYRWFSGVRQVGARRPIAISTIIVRAMVAPSAAVIDRLDESVSEWIERHHDTRIAVVEQRIAAVAFCARDAKRLGVEAGSPALETVRHYRDAAGGDVLVSHSLHPAGRFAYTMVMERDR
jgi:DNA-binding GntR family transcriptional regulator